MYVSQSGVKHDDSLDGFLAASHWLPSAAAPLAALQSTVRNCVPPVMGPHGTEQALHDEMCHVYVSHAGVTH